MKKSVIIFILMLLCPGLDSVGLATTVDANEGWEMTLQPGESITCIANFIPDIPDIPDSLIFPQIPDWIQLFVPEALNWDMALADEGKTAYIFGPAITNNGTDPLDIFEYRLYYQWDDDDPDFDANYPVYLDIVVFNDQEIIRDFAYRGIPDGPFDPLNPTTWKEQHDPGSDPYDNPVPEPMTICFLGIGAVYLRKRR